MEEINDNDFLESEINARETLTQLQGESESVEYSATEVKASTDTVDEADLSNAFKKGGLLGGVMVLFKKLITWHILGVLGVLALWGILLVLAGRINDSLIVDAESIQDQIKDIHSRQIFVSSKLIEYQRQENIEKEITDKKLNLQLGETPPYAINNN